jgi:two-component system, NarL family, nitrate/nitrite response regulator NarL
MSLDTLHQKQLLPTDHRPLQQIPAILMCKNSLVRAGIRHIINGTRFIVAGEVDDRDQSCLPFLVASSALYIIRERHSADALAKMVVDLKGRPLARVVVLADDLDHKTIMRAFDAGMDGLCSTRMERHVLLKVLELVMLGGTFIPTALSLAMLTETCQAHGDKPSETAAVTSA